MSVYELNAEVPLADKELCIPFAWPFDAWECVIPSSVNPKINILEKLILSLISSGAVTTAAEMQAFLHKDIGLDEELVENAFAICLESGYINKTRTTLELNKIAKDLLATCDNGVITDHDYAESRKRVYLFKDLISDAIVPCFEVELLPQYPVKFSEFRGITLQAKQQTGERLKTDKCRTAMRIWGRMFSESIRAEASSSNSLNLTGKPAQSKADEDSVSEKAEKTKSAGKAEMPAYDLMQIHSEKPENLQLIGYFVINRYCTSEIRVISPFGDSCDTWFLNLVNRLRLADEAFEEQLESMVSDRVESLKDKIAFNNVPAVAIFDKLPMICNDLQYDELRKRIVILNNYLEDVHNRDTHLSVFASAMRQAIEDAARFALRKHPEVEITRAAMKTQFDNTNNHKAAWQRIKTAGADYSFGKGILDNMIRNKPGECSGAKDVMALIVIDSGEHAEHTAICKFATACHGWIKDIPDLITILNKASHGEAARMNKTPEEYYKQTENIISDLFGYLIN